VETMPSSVTSSWQSVVVDEHHSDSTDIWTAVVHHKLDKHYTWEAVGRYDSVDILVGSRPSDHYFRSVYLFVCAEFFSAVFDLISRIYVICLGLVVSPRI